VGTTRIKLKADTEVELRSPDDAEVLPEDAEITLVAVSGGHVGILRPIIYDWWGPPYR
jgi:hypothetical protein